MDDYQVDAAAFAEILRDQRATRMIDNVGKALTVDAIEEYHRILKEGTEDSRRPWFRVGDWKAVPNQVGDVVTTAPEQVAAEIALLLEATPREMTFDDICNFHYRFEAIHPFQDGNGRVGRLIMFGQCLQNDVMPFVVLDELKYFYYRGLAEFASEPGYLRDTFRTCQDRYYERFKRFVPHGR